MALHKTDDLKEQIEIGKEIVSRHPELYGGGLSQNYLEIINRLKGDRPFTTWWRVRSRLEHHRPDDVLLTRRASRHSESLSFLMIKLQNR